MKFIDEITIVIGSGKGGPGAIHFRREAMTPRGGPDGGDGGKGDLILKTAENLNSLVDYRYNARYCAAPGSGRFRSKLFGRQWQRFGFIGSAGHGCEKA